MVIFQESSEAGERDKQLRISGIPDKVDHAKQMVNDLLVEKELEQANRSKTNFISPLNDYGSTRITYHEYPVSPQLIGLVIGKGGETIRKIQADSGCKVQFDTSKVDTHGNKICQFTGTPDCVNRALDMVKEIIETVTGGQVCWRKFFSLFLRKNFFNFFLGNGRRDKINCTNIKNGYRYWTWR